MNVADLQARLARSLEKARGERGLSQDKLAEMFGPTMRRNEINAMEHGLRRITEVSLVRFINLLDHDPSWWFTDHRNGDRPE